MLATLRQAFSLGLLGAIVGAQPSWALEVLQPQSPRSQKTALPDASNRSDLVSVVQGGSYADVHHVASWVVLTRDNQSLPFLIVDKARAQVFVFHADGQLRGNSPALLGLAIGDDSVPGIGTRKLASILPQERTTPAGRFVANLDRNLGGKEILWVDYESAISLHPVITSNTKERRAERLASSSALDNRISYGCINVSLDFFKHVVSPAFADSNGIVYVLPETRSVKQFFSPKSVASLSQ